jgi:hypothetical protein
MAGARQFAMGLLDVASRGRRGQPKDLMRIDGHASGFHLQAGFVQFRILSKSVAAFLIQINPAQKETR